MESGSVYYVSLMEVPNCGNGLRCDKIQQKNRKTCPAKKPDALSGENVTYLQRTIASATFVPGGGEYRQ